MSTEAFRGAPPAAPVTETDPVLLLAQAREQGTLLHDMPLAVKQLLANQYEIYTVTTQRHPGKLRHHLPRVWYARALGRIAADADTMMQDAPGYEEAVQTGTLDIKLKQVFGTITSVDSSHGHVAERKAVRRRVDDPSRPGRTIKVRGFDGIATAEAMRFSVEAAPQVDLLLLAFQGLLHKPKRFTPSNTGSAQKQIQPERGSDSNQPGVTVYGIHEYDLRSLDRTRKALWLRRLAAQGIILPEQRTLEYLDQTETLPPWLRDELTRDRDTYLRTPAHATYEGALETTVEVPTTRLTSSDIPALKRGRDILNRIIRPMRGGKHRNLEQHPRQAERPTVEQRAFMRRYNVRPEDAELGPPAARVLNQLEIWTFKISEGARYALKHPARALWATATWSAQKFFGGLADIAIAPVKHIPKWAKAVYRFGTDIADWHRQKQQAIAEGYELDVIAGELLAARRARVVSLQARLAEHGLQLRTSAYSDPTE